MPLPLQLPALLALWPLLGWRLGEYPGSGARTLYLLWWLTVPLPLALWLAWAVWRDGR